MQRAAAVDIIALVSRQSHSLRVRDVGSQGHGRLRQHGACVKALGVDLNDRNAGVRIAVHERVMDRARAAVLRQQRRVDVDGAALKAIQHE